MSTTFRIPGVQPLDRPKPLGEHVAFATILGGSESYSRTKRKWVQPPPMDVVQSSGGECIRTSSHPLISTALEAFAEHRPLVLAPDAIWFTIAQGIAKHIGKDPERHRKTFVNFEGRKTLQVDVTDRPEWSHPKAKTNPWDKMFPEWAAMMREDIGEKADLFVGEFSSTGQIESLAQHIAFFSAMENYFELGVYTRCGIPEFTLEGTPDDWRNIQDRVSFIGEIDGLAPWSEILCPIAEEFVRASEGNPTHDFWHSFVKENSMSGGPYITGQIVNLFAYLSKGQDSVPNPYIFEGKKLSKEGWGCPRLEAFGSDANGRCTTSIFWNHVGTMYDFNLHGGLMGFEETEKGLRPSFGWAVEAPTLRDQR